MKMSTTHVDRCPVIGKRTSRFSVLEGGVRSRRDESGVHKTRLFQMAVTALLPPKEQRTRVCTAIFAPRATSIEDRLSCTAWKPETVLRIDHASYAKPDADKLM
jgi:hypothetical protein